MPGDAERPDDLSLLEPLGDELSNVVHVEVLVRRSRAVQGEAGDAGGGRRVSGMYGDHHLVLHALCMYMLGKSLEPRARCLRLSLRIV